MKSFLELLMVLVGVCLLTTDGLADKDSVDTRAARSADGLSIAYDVRGQGELALVFIHGWACQRSFWREQRDVFAGDYRVVSLDLGGHGQSGTDREKWSVESLARDVQAVVEDLDLKRVILVGHSMGGPACLIAARLMPDRVEAVVGVDTLHDAEFVYPKPPPEKVVSLCSRFEEDFPGTIASVTRATFSENADADMVQWVIERASAAHKEAVLAIARYMTMTDWDLKRGFSEAKVPIRCINSEPGLPGTQPTKIETNRQYADFDAVIINGVGHFPMTDGAFTTRARLRYQRRLGSQIPPAARARCRRRTSPVPASDA